MLENIQGDSWGSIRPLRMPSLLLHDLCHGLPAEDDNFKMMIFFYFSQFIRHTLSSFFTFPICFKCRATVEWSTLSSSAASCIVVYSFLYSHHQLQWWLAIGCWLPIASHCAPHLKPLVSFAELPEPPLHCMFTSTSWAKCVVDVVHCLCCFMNHFELE